MLRGVVARHPSPAALARFLALVVLLVLAGPLAGCTLAGAYLGDMVPAYGAPQGRVVREGEAVRVHRRPEGESGVEPSIDGVYRGRDERAVRIEIDGRERGVPSDEVESVDVRRGTAWKEGMIVGAVIDATWVALACFLAADSSSMLFRDGL